jgi:hypothetical protein
MEDNTRNMKAVWTVVERGQANGVTKSYWTRVGVGFVNRDGSLTLKLDAIPLSGSLQVREWESWDRRGDGGEPGQRRGSDFGDPGGGRSQRPRQPPQPPAQPGPGDSLV